MKQTTKRVLVLGCLVAAAHFLVAMTCLMISSADTMRRFDEGGPNRSALMSFLHFFWTALMEPGFTIWGLLPGSRLPDSIEWMIVFANSLLWGFGIAFPVFRFRAWLSRVQRTD